MRKVCYAHPNSNELVLRNINLKLEKGKKYGFVGESGSGKSTLFDIFLGFVLLVLLVVPILLIVIAVRFTSKGPVLYWSDRIGKKMQSLKCQSFALC